MVAAYLAALHLLSVCVFIWLGAPDGASAWRVAARTYQNVSGSFRDYTFFAPAVASDLRAGFFLEDAAGGASFVSFAAENREIGFRYNSIVAACMRDVRGRDLFARSWAALILSANPAAHRTTVVVEAFDVPDMAAYRQGARPEWVLVYAGVFEPTAAP